MQLRGPFSRASAVSQVSFVLRGLHSSLSPSLHFVALLPTLFEGAAHRPRAGQQGIAVRLGIRRSSRVRVHPTPLAHLVLWHPRHLLFHNASTPIACTPMNLPLGDSPPFCVQRYRRPRTLPSVLYSNHRIPGHRERTLLALRLVVDHIPLNLARVCSDHVALDLARFRIAVGHGVGEGPKYADHATQQHGLRSVCIARQKDAMA
ncbi:hypothetical protein CC85DRAFT_1943 [Cutaneotrichosporon oleaginosum]|uniref:Uncharacterized protein n=1 Tax=Cutaneotrichosporon oleaginosum TaxID=879819 RepID=A0A0J0XZG9_9TREE|nr:uncharacterized protein CC85DRAFT_1943 [Cutaneotrichosporon oleaginosum]KLT46422.1 hypothetical protein CC85DRAFT_1943 [Cutaneotrichosporon oleaginosum]TXT15208.1 hypothetical protein COLE_01401 [Cutaneotrichosporon oleaginosum]